MATVTRPSGAYTPSNPITNTTKYQDDSAAVGPRVAISSAKVDGDINKAFDKLTDHDNRLDKLDAPVANTTEVVVAAGDTFVFADASDSNTLKRDTVQGLLDLTVSSVALSMPAEFSVSGSPLTGPGTITVSKANATANTVYAGPTSGGAAAPTLRPLVAADIPSITAAMLAVGIPSNLASQSKTDTFTTSSTSFTDITGLSTTITPKSSSSNVLVVAVVDCITNGSGQGALRLTRGGSAIGVGDSAGSRIQAGTSVETGTAFGTVSKVLVWLDSPATTSPTTYAVQAMVNNAGATFYCNRTGDDSNASTRFRTSSFIFALGL